MSAGEEIKHTATPWYLGQHAMGGMGASVVATIDCIAITAYGAFATPEEDAAFIVRACNRDHAFDELVAAVAQAVDKDIGYFNEEARGITYKEVKALRAALAKAGA